MVLSPWRLPELQATIRAMHYRKVTIWVRVTVVVKVNVRITVRIKVAVRVRVGVRFRVTVKVSISGRVGVWFGLRFVLVLGSASRPGSGAIPVAPARAPRHREGHALQKGQA